MGDLLVILLLGSFFGMLISVISPKAALLKASSRLSSIGRWAVIFGVLAGLSLVVDLEGAGNLPDGLNVLLFAMLFIAWPAFAVITAIRKKTPAKPLTKTHIPELLDKAAVKKAQKVAAAKAPPPPVTSQTTPKPSANLRFTYKDRFGNITDRELTWWEDQGDRIYGGDLTRGGEERTFIKDRIVAYSDKNPAFKEPQSVRQPKAINQQIKTNQMEVCFTGFDSERKKMLEGIASGAGMKVRTKVTKNLDFLVCSAEEKSPSKVNKAKSQGAYILDEEGFSALIFTGEVGA